MMNKKKKLILIHLIGILFIIFVSSAIPTIPRQLTWSNTLFCSGIAYEEVENIGCLTIEFDYVENSREVVLSITDEKMKEDLRNLGAEEVVGVNLTLDYLEKDLELLLKYWDEYNSIEDIILNRDIFDDEIVVLQCHFNDVE